MLISSKAFNTVNQRDSRSLKGDSQAMKVIAVMTMLFLPATAVAVRDHSLLSQRVQTKLTPDRQSSGPSSLISTQLLAS